MIEPDRVYGVVIVNDIPCPVTNMFDALGEDTDDIESAVTGIAMVHEDCWVTFNATAINIGKLS